MVKNQPVRILHVITTLGRGGAERQLVNLVSNTDRTALEHTVCYLHPPDDFANELRQAGLEVICLNLPRKWPWLFAPKRLVPLLRAQRPDLIQTWLFEADISVRLSTLMGPSIPIVNTLHLTSYDPDTIRSAEWSRTKLVFVRQIDKWTARWTKPLFIAVSETVKQSAVRNLRVPDADVRVIYNSIDQATLRCAPDEPPRVRQEANVPPDGFVFINVGRLAPQKGQSILLRAFQQVAAELPDTYLIFVGEGPEAESLAALARELGVADRVRFIGRRVDVGACLEMAQVFVFPSLFEGFGLAPIEAMLKGLPCIVTRIGPVLELFALPETGILVAPGSVSELAAAMSELYHDSELRQRLGMRAQALANDQFDSRVGLRAWEQLYSELGQQMA